MKKSLGKSLIKIFILCFYCFYSKYVFAADDLLKAYKKAEALFYISLHADSEPRILNDKSPTFQMCFLGEDESLKQTKLILEKLEVRGRPVRVYHFKRLRKLSILSACELIIIGKLKQDHLDLVVPQLHKLEAYGHVTITTVNYKQYKGLIHLGNEESTKYD